MCINSQLTSERTKNPNKTTSAQWQQAGGSRVRSIYAQASPLERYLFVYLRPLSERVRKWRWLLRARYFDDYSPIECRSLEAGGQLEQSWQFELKRRQDRASLTRVVLRLYGPSFALASLLLLAADCLLEPLYFYLSIQLIEVIGQLHSGGGDPDGSSQMSNELGQGELRWRLIRLTVGFLCALGGTFAVSHPFAWAAHSMALKLQVALSRLVYAKSLRMDKLPHQAIGKSRMQQVDHKQALSLVSRDVAQFETNLNQLAWVVSGPLQCLVMTGLISQMLDLQTALVAIALNSSIAFQRGYMNINMRKFAREAARLADQRVALSTEAVDAVRVLRSYAWTRPVADKIEKKRAEELVQRRRCMFVSCLDNTTFFVTTSCFALCTLMFSHYVRGLPVTQASVSQIFLVCAIYRRTLSRLLPSGILAWIHLCVTLSRCGKYLRANERLSSGHQALACKKLAAQDKDDARDAWQVKASELSFGWPPGSRAVNEQEPKQKSKTNKKSKQQQQDDANIKDKPVACLTGLNFQLAQGQLLLVAGRVGAGKSTLVQLLLGELTPSAGWLELGTGTKSSSISNSTLAKLAYAPQQAWIFSGSVRDNILLGEPLQLGRYVRVLRACCLLPDLFAFARFDRTQIGERGVTLSGGQKARVSLARALYQRADLYVLDDPLSAVDAQVAPLIFKRALRDFLCDKAVVLVTHQLQFLRQADNILYLRQESAAAGADAAPTGSRGHFGTYEQLERAGLIGELLAGTKLSSPEAGQQDVSNLDDHNEAPSEGAHDEPSDELVERRMLSDALDFGSDCANGDNQNHYDQQQDELHDVLLVESRRNANGIWRSMNFYLLACGRASFVVYITAVLACRACFIFISMWLNFWAGYHRNQDKQLASQTATRQQDDNIAAQLSLEQAFYVAGLLFVAVSVSALLYTTTYFRLVSRGARAIHTKLLESILWTRLQFFDRTPQGHLVGCLSADISHLDTVHVRQIDELAHTGISLVLIFCSLIWSAPKIFLGVFLVLASFRALFGLASPLMELTRHLDGHRRAAIYSHLGTTLDGIEVIRAAQKQQLFMERFAELQDKHSSVKFLDISLRRFVASSLGWLMVAFFTLLLTIDVYDTLQGHGQLAFVGLNLVVNLTRYCQLGFSEFIDFYFSIKALERIRDFCRLDSEQSLAQRAAAPYHWRPAESEVSQTRPPSETLVIQRGEIEFVGVLLKYQASSKLVLSQLSFRVRAGEKVGIVGRTGAGKSSLISILLRLYHFEGFVLIDGQDTKQLALDALRKSIGIIPQDPTLFAGSLRYNLDPFDEHPDAELWRALEAVQLSELIRVDGPRQLATQVSEAGANFSVGQRQLICLARAILRGNKLLLLDEATANVDQQTDRLIQQAIRQQFRHCTVLTVAHRLNTLIDSDRIMVVDSGRLVEFGTPSELAQRPTGAFRRMVESTGERQAALLFDKIATASSAPTD